MTFETKLSGAVVRDGSPPPTMSRAGRVLHRLRSVASAAIRNPSLAIGLAGVLLAAGVAFLAPLLTPHDPLVSNLTARLTPPAWASGGSRDHILGTDQLGRDVLSRIIYGSRTSLLVGVSAVGIAATLGTAAGIIAGYRGGFVDEVLMRIADIRLNIPFVLLLITVLAIFGSGLRNIIILLALTEWVIYARVIRAETLGVREREFVAASRALGAKDGWIMRRHILPSVASLVVVLASVEVGQLILLESTLGFLGLGVPPPTPTWGNMLGEGREYLANAWWLATFPGLALTITVICLTLVGDGLRDWLDPHSRERV